MITSTSKPIKKMVLWTRTTNSKSFSPHDKDKSKHNNQIKNKLGNINNCKNQNENEINNASISENSPQKNINFSQKQNKNNSSRVSSNDRNINSSNSAKSNFDKNYKIKIKKHNLLNPCNDKGNYIKTSTENKNEKNTLINNINANYNITDTSLGNNVINNSEYHTTGTFKYFQSSNGLNLKKTKQKNNKKKQKKSGENKLSLEKKYKNNVSQQKITPKNKPHLHKISPNNNKICNSSNNGSRNNFNNDENKDKKTAIKSLKGMQNIQINKNNKIINDIISEDDDSNEVATLKNNYDVNGNINNLKEENELLKQENQKLITENKELKRSLTNLENEITELKIVLKDNLNYFIKPQDSLIKKIYKKFFDEIEKFKNDSKSILNYNTKIFTFEDDENDDTKRANEIKENIKKEKELINDKRNNFNHFKKNFFEYFNHICTTNINVSGNSKTNNDPLKIILNSFCSFMDNIVNRIDNIFTSIDKIKTKNNTIKNLKDFNSINEEYLCNFKNNYCEICFLNLYYEYIIMQMFIVSFFERQNSSYCYSIIDYIMESPFLILKNNKYIKEYSNKIAKIFDCYKIINEEYINQFTKQNIFYLDQYIKLFTELIFNINRSNESISVSNDSFLKNTNVLFDNEKKTQEVYLSKINQLMELINKGNKNKEKKCNINMANPDIIVIDNLKNKSKINTIKLPGNNMERMSNISNSSSKVIENYSEKPSFIGFIGNDDVPPDMSFDEDE